MDLLRGIGSGVVEVGVWVFFVGFVGFIALLGDHALWHSLVIVVLGLVGAWRREDVVDLRVELEDDPYNVEYWPTPSLLMLLRRSFQAAFCLGAAGLFAWLGGEELLARP